VNQTDLTDCGMVTDEVSLIEPFKMSLQCRFSIHYNTHIHKHISVSWPGVTCTV